jgi:glycosyltransferase involved in cell wall biosynthesis
MISYSIIIPSKNLPDLLQRALDSIPRRDDIQVIVVDDASDPGLVDFASYPGLGDPCVEVVFTKEARGAGYARNAGLERAAGRWTLFLDCDDLFTPECLTLLDAHLEDDADIVFFNITSAYSDGLDYSPRHLARSEYFTAYDGARREFCCRYLYTEPWGKMFRTDFLREDGFRFEETPLANDFRFSVMTGIAAGRVVTDPRPLCCITERRGSLSHDFCSTPLQLSTRLAVYYGVQELLDAAGIRSYPFFKLVNFTLRHRRDMKDILRDFCSDRRIGYNSLRFKTLFYRILFSRWHRRHWAIF